MRNLNRLPCLWLVIIKSLKWFSRSWNCAVVDPSPIIFNLLIQCYTWALGAQSYTYIHHSTIQPNVKKSSHLPRMGWISHWILEPQSVGISELQLCKLTASKLKNHDFWHSWSLSPKEHQSIQLNLQISPSSKLWWIDASIFNLHNTRFHCCCIRLHNHMISLYNLVKSCRLVRFRLFFVVP